MRTHNDKIGAKDAFYLESKTIKFYIFINIKACKSKSIELPRGHRIAPTMCCILLCH